MKYILTYTLLIFVISLGCNNTSGTETGEETNLSVDEIKNPNTINENNDQSDGYPEMTFEKSFHNFGSIEQGEVVKFDFEFTNTGNSDLIISNASATCGCTIPEWPREPIKPGETGLIPVEYNSRGKANLQQKTITITANTNPNINTLNIEAFVEVN